MKDVLIPGPRMTREFLIFGGCFVIALGLNIFSIIKYQTQWKELFTTLHITFAVAVVIYIVFALMRFLICGIASLFRRKTG